MNYSEGYTFKFDNRMLDALILYDDTGKPMFVKVYGALEKSDKAAFLKVCLAINTLIRADVFEYRKHHNNISKLNDVDQNIINFFERNIFALLKIS